MTTLLCSGRSVGHGAGPWLQLLCGFPGTLLLTRNGCERTAAAPAAQVGQSSAASVAPRWADASGQSLFPAPSVPPSCCRGWGNGQGVAAPAPLALLCFMVKKEKKNLPWCFFLLKINFYE